MSDIPLKPFFMLRHGETVANVQGLLAGSLDTPLTDKGRAQAAQVQPVLRLLPVQPSVIFCSPLSRTRETAQIVNAGKGLPLSESSDFAEQCFGDWAGKPWAEFGRESRRGEDPPNGEPNFFFQRRVLRGLACVLRADVHPLIVTSGGVFDAIAESFGFFIDDVKNCSLHGFEPKEEQAPFPWHVWHYKESGERLEKKEVSLHPLSQE